MGWRLPLGPVHSLETVSRNDTTALLEGFAKVARCSSVSALALMHWLARLLSFAQRPTKLPDRIPPIEG